MNAWRIQDFKKVIKIIKELKSAGLIKEYAIGGGIATICYAESYSTEDLDVFIIPTGRLLKRRLILFSPITNYLRKKGYNYRWSGLYLLIEGIPVQFIPPKDGLEIEAIENARNIKYSNTAFRTFAPEYLIAILLRVGRRKDSVNVEMILNEAIINKGKLKEILRRYRLENLWEKFIKGA